MDSYALCISSSSFLQLPSYVAMEFVVPNFVYKLNIFFINIYSYFFTDIN